jgi:uncharacterized protein (TIGR03437 family)
MTLLNKIVIALVGASLPVLIYGYAEGPDAGLAGVPGEASCTYCHSGGSGSGNVQVTFPGGLVYTPGVAQHLVVTVSDSSQRRWGFELTARQANNTKVQAGTFAPGSDGFTQLVCTQTTFQTESFGSSCPSSMPMQYVEHTLRGTQNGVRNSASFQFDWTPPASDVGSVVVYVAGNAANGDNNTTGDHIYLQHYTLSAAPPPTPAPAITSVVNAAGQQPGIAADGWVTIQGTNLANSSRPWSPGEIVNGALPTQLDGVSVTIDGNPAYISYISPTQINVQAPDDASLGPVSVVVNNNNGASAPFTVQLQPASPAVYLWSSQYSVSTAANCGVVAESGVFGGVTAPPVQSSGVLTLWGMGLGPADPTAACGFIGPATLFSNVPTAPAAPGDTVVLWGTGFGPTSPAAPAGQLVPAGQVDSVTTSPSVLIGGVPAQVVSAALAAGQAGLYQITVQVPNGLADGDQPVVIQVNGVQSPAGVFITVQNVASGAAQN